MAYHLLLLIQVNFCQFFESKGNINVS